MKTNPYDALRKIAAITAGTPPMSATGAINRVCNDALAGEHQPGPYATQGDALEAIRCKAQEANDTYAFIAELREIAEQGLSLPAVELTQAQQKADMAVELALRCLNAMSRAGTYRRGNDMGDLYHDLIEHIEPLRPKPPAPPTLGEALDVLRGLLSSDLSKSEVQAAHQLLARVPK